jgi:hypothetical protein
LKPKKRLPNSFSFHGKARLIPAQGLVNVVNEPLPPKTAGNQKLEVSAQGFGLFAPVNASKLRPAIFQIQRCQA